MSAQVAADLRPGDVITYEPESRWCYDGWAIATQRRDGDVVLVDTYWISGGKVVAPAEFEFQFNLADYEEKPLHVWETFAQADRKRVPQHAGYQSVYLVRKGAKPDLTTRIENARERVAEAEAKVRSAALSLDFARRELAALEAQQ